MVIVERHQRPIVSARLVFGEGAVHEPPEATGSTHFAVSLLAGYYEVNADGKPIPEADSFARKVFYSGGELKLAVNAESAYFGIDGYAADIAVYLRLLSRAIRRPRCGPQSFAARRNATIHSLEEIELSDPSVFQLFVNQAAFGSGHPYARPTFGTIRTLKELDLGTIEDRQRALLNPANSTLVVVGEHADFRARRLGEDPKTAASRAASRMFLPVFSATITTVIAFFGLVAIGGRFGELILDIPFTVIVVLIASLVECFLILPNHMAHALVHTAKEHWYDWPSRQVNKGFRWVRERLFRPFIAGVIHARYLVLAGATAILASQVVLVISGDVQWRFFNAPERGSISA
ncbi:MAG: efflux RND transporter permease subunit, partial [Myxococcota bacterium]